MNFLFSFRAIYRWITVKDLNVMEFEETIETDTPMGLLRGIKYGTETYHVLFMRLCGWDGTCFSNSWNNGYNMYISVIWCSDLATPIRNNWGYYNDQYVLFTVMRDWTVKKSKVTRKVLGMSLGWRSNPTNFKILGMPCLLTVTGDSYSVTGEPGKLSSIDDQKRLKQFYWRLTCIS